MSIHYFGKVKTYKKYENDLPHYTGYVCNDGGPYKVQEIIFKKTTNSRGEEICYKGISRFPSCHDLKNLIPLNIPEDYLHSTGCHNHLNMKNHLGQHNSPYTVKVTPSYMSSLAPDAYVFSFTSLVETFSKCVEKVREKMYSDLWKTIECCPFINIMDLLILKQSDTDKHIEHLEEMIRGLMEDNKLLQNRINALVPVTVGELLLS